MTEQKVQQMLATARRSLERYLHQKGEFQGIWHNDDVDTESRERAGQQAVVEEEELLSHLRALSTHLPELNRIIERAAENLTTLEAGEAKLQHRDMDPVFDEPRDIFNAEIRMGRDLRYQVLNLIMDLAKALKNPDKGVVAIDFPQSRLHEPTSRPLLDEHSPGPIRPGAADELLGLNDSPLDL
ncbi:MAG: hypothetical protein WD534_15130 [Phycisphaeraceae bacterium]